MARFPSFLDGVVRQMLLKDVSQVGLGLVLGMPLAIGPAMLPIAIVCWHWRHRQLPRFPRAGPQTSIRWRHSGRELSVIDSFTKESLALEVDTSLPSGASRGAEQSDRESWQADGDSL